MSNQIAAVIFDFGGVIIPGAGDANALADQATPFGRIEARYGLEPGTLWAAHYETETWRRLRVGEGTAELWHASVHEALLGQVDAETARAILAELGEPRPVEFNEGMIELIQRLRGRVKVGLLSNAAPGLEEELAGHYRIDHLFDDIINSATVRLAKPDPRIYALAAERLGVDLRRCFFTDDLPHNIEAAREAGMTAHQFDGYEGLVRALQAAGVDCG
ncbi:MAG: HAD family hydrolase [Hyphomicrobiales bacterium]